MYFDLKMVSKLLDNNIVAEKVERERDRDKERDRERQRQRNREGGK